MDITKLRKAVDWSYDALEPYRTLRYDLIKETAGKYYAQDKDGTREKIPVNFLELAKIVYLRAIIMRAPRVTGSTDYEELRPVATKIAQVVNQIIEEIEWGTSLKSWIMDGFFGLSILKTGIYKKGSVNIDGYLHDVGQIYSDHISLDNYVRDMSCNTQEEIEYEGHRYRVPLEYVKDNDDYDKLVRAQLTATSNDDYVNDGKKKVGSLGKKAGSNEGEIRDFVDLWELWIPKEDKIITLPMQVGLNPLLVKDWDGPETGPYDKIAFEDIPDNTMPLAPFAIIYDLHTLANILFLKLSRQAQNQKTVGVYKGTAAKDAELVRTAGDMEFIKVTDPQGVKEISFNGANPNTLAMFLKTKELFNVFSNNVELLGGMAQMGDTLGQEQMMSTNAGQRIADMKQVTYEAIKKAVDKIAFYAFYDPMLNRDIRYTIEGTDVEITLNINAEDEKGDFIQHKFEIEPSSMQVLGPQEKITLLGQIMDKYVLPFIPIMEAQGVQIDLMTLYDMISEYFNLPQLKTILKYGMGQHQGGSLSEERQMKAPETQRTYNRINRSTKTPQGQDTALSQVLMGQGMQPSQMQGVGGA